MMDSHALQRRYSGCGSVEYNYVCVCLYFRLLMFGFFSYLRAVMYHRRNKFNPLYNHLLVAGMSKNGDAFLGSVDDIGTSFCDDITATGFGAHLALPILRRCWKADMTEGEARGLLEDCMRVLFYRLMGVHMIVMLV